MVGTLTTFSTASPNAGAILPPQYSQLIIKPLESQSLTFNPQVASSQQIVANELRIPRVIKDPTVGWVGEGEQISESVPEVDQVNITPKKVAGIVPVTRELANDSNPAAQALVGESLARDIARKIDAAFFGNVGGHAPAGLESLTDIHTLDGGTLDDLDVLAEAVSLLENSGHEATSFVTTPAIALRLATLKVGQGSNAPLLAEPRTVLNRPVFVSPDVSAGTLWAVDAKQIHTALREDVELAVSEHTYFDTDKIAIRATLRVGFGHPAPEAVAKVNVTTADNG